MMQEMARRENYFMKKTVASSLEAECCLDPADIRWAGHLNFHGKHAFITLFLHLCLTCLQNEQ